MHRRWVTSIGKRTIGRRLRKGLLGRAAPGMEIEDISFDLEDIVLKLIGWVIKLVVLVLVVPIVLVVVWLIGLFELIGRLVLRRPWVIDGYARDGSQVRWREKGLRQARVRRDGIRAALAAGAAPQGGDIVSLPGR